MADSERQQYPVQCVNCSVDKGFPFLVRTIIEKPGHIEIKLRCRDCGHEWAKVVSNRE
jgi:hypothetical protein